MNTPTTMNQNLLLAALSGKELAHIAPNLELVEMKLGDKIYEPNVPLQYVYFPTTAIVSLLNMTEDGSTAQIAVVGKEGIVGFSLFMGSETSLNWAVVQSCGLAYRLNGQQLKEVFRIPQVQYIFLRYMQVLLTQTAQTAICNRFHTVEQQLCRLLLITMDRLPSSILMMTQELIANMLGVRREGITEAACRLQKAGVISYKRGRITIHDRKGLESRVCECYEVVKKETDRLSYESCA